MADERRELDTIVDGYGVLDRGKGLAPHRFDVIRECDGGHCERVAAYSTVEPAWWLCDRLRAADRQGVAKEREGTIAECDERSAWLEEEGNRHAARAIDDLVDWLRKLADPADAGG